MESRGLSWEYNSVLDMFGDFSICMLLIVFRDVINLRTLLTVVQRPFTPVFIFNPCASSTNIDIKAWKGH
jgi:hypothetical protein